MRLNPRSAPWFADTSQGWSSCAGGEADPQTALRVRSFRMKAISESQGEFVPAEIGSWFLVMQEAVGGAEI